jgi:hypothetical protein
MGGHTTCRGRGEVYTGLWWGNLKERDYFFFFFFYVGPGG